MPSIDHVIGELSHVKAAIPRLGSVVFHDDAFFFIEKEVMQEFASRYRREIGLPFAALGATSTSITQEKVDLLVRAGMNRVRMGIQSGSPETLRLYNRRTPRKSIIEASRVLASHRRALIPTGYDLIVDNPYETREDVLQTIDLLDKLTPPFTLNMFSLQFLPGTRLARKAFEDGISDPDRESAKHYRLYRPTYINLIVAMFGIGKVPTRLLRLLTGSSRIHSDRTYPLLGKLIFILTLLRRGLHHLSYADFTVFPGRWAVPASRALNALPRRRPGFGPRDKLP
jgi:hypothetical protein